MATESFKSLLMTDLDGHQLDDPDDVIHGALDDNRYLDRAPALIGLLHDESAPPYERFVAALALITWAEPVGYQTVIAAAADPAGTPWYEHSLDRRYSVDDSFAEMAAAVAASKEYSQAKHTDDLRIKALHALLAIADQQFFDWKLALALDEETVGRLTADVRAAVERGVRQLSHSVPAKFDLAPQLADLAAALAPVDEHAAVELGYDIARVDSSPRTLTHLCAISARGREPVSLQFLDYLRTLGGADIMGSIDDALAQRHSAARG